MKDGTVAAGSATPHVLELTVKNCAELFDASMPSCLGRRILHKEIAKHLLEEIATVPSHEPIKLKLMVPAAEAADADVIAAAIRTHFEHCREEEQRHLRGVLRDGRNALGIALVVLAVVNAIGASIHATFSGRFAGALAAGLEIFGWVAMWIPAEYLLYDWVPVRRKRNLLARLARMEIEFHPIEQ
jgi:hypothetical protein